MFQAKKRKVDKRELAENNRFFCDRCDRGFKTEEKYNEHTSQHQQVCGHTNMFLCMCVCFTDVSRTITFPDRRFPD